ncbi:hypothetical protein GCM10010417_54490 [Streptomyces carpaticus]
MFLTTAIGLGDPRRVGDVWGFPWCFQAPYALVALLGVGWALYLCRNWLGIIFSAPRPWRARVAWVTPSDPPAGVPGMGVAVR